MSKGTFDSKEVKDVFAFHTCVGVGFPYNYKRALVANVVGAQRQVIEFELGTLVDINV